MKKVIVVSASAMAGVSPTQALADRDKTDFYMTGKAGASVVTQTDWRFRQGSGNDVYEYKGGDKNDTIFGAGLMVDYDSCQHYNVPMCTEVESYGRGAADSHCTLDTWHSPIRGGGRGDTQSRLSVSTLMMNTYYDLRNNSASTPWVSVRLGYAQMHRKTAYTDTPWNRSGEVSGISALHYSGCDNGFAWSIGTGVRYNVIPDIALDLSYHYLDADKSSPSYRDAERNKYRLGTNIKSHNVMFGVTYNF